MTQKLPDGWRIMKLADICENISAGGTPARDKKEYWQEGTIPWLKIADMKSVYIKETEEKITKVGLDNSSAKLFPKGTLVYSIFATLGAIGILEIDATTNQAIAGIIPKKEIVSTKYLYYCLKADRDKILAKKSHATQDNLNLTVLRNHEIIVPPNSVQQKIVSILEKAEKAKEMRKEADELTKDFLKAVFIEMFGDPVRNNKNWGCDILGRHLKVLGGFAFKSEDFVEKGISLVKIGTVNKGYFDISNCSLLPEDYLVKYSKYQIKKGDILISLTGTVGKDDYGNVCICNNDKPFLLNQRVGKLEITSSKLNELYLLYYLKNEKIKFKLTDISRGVRQANISNKDIEVLKIPLPSIELQHKFASIVKEVESMKEQQKHSKEHLDNLFNALMQKAFKGELVV